MNSTDLPVTEWWDPEFGYFDVPIAADGVPYDVWWPAYEHIAEIEWITTGRTWGWIDGLFARQLTTGDDVYDVQRHDPADCNICRPFIGPLFVVAGVPKPCTCEYHAMRWVLPIPFIETLRHTILDVGGLHAASWITINPACPHHGDRPWS